MNVPITIIIPLYNKERHVERSLMSVFAQSYNNYEIIVVDDGSTDRSTEIVKGLGVNHEIQILYQKNAGVSSARNNGIEQAKHEHIAFLDADDAWKPDFLKNIVKLINKFPEAGAYATDYDIMSKEGRLHIPVHRFIPKESDEVLIPNYFRSMIYGDPMITSSSVCLKKETFKKAGSFPIEEKLGEDKDMWARVALFYPIAFSWYIGATYYENADNRTCLKYIPNYERYFIKTLQKKLDNNEVPEKFMTDVRKYISKNLIHLAAKNIKTGNSKFAKELLKDKRCNIYYLSKIKWNVIAYIPFRILSISIKYLKYLRDYPLYYMLRLFRKS